MMSAKRGNDRVISIDLITSFLSTERGEAASLSSRREGLISPVARGVKTW